jgi:hypothetical protein
LIFYGATYPQFTITENVTLEAGNWTHVDNSTTEANRLKVSVGGYFHLESNATISVNGLGFNNLQGPGAPTANYDAGGYGGIGGDYGNNGVGMGPTYGSYTAPTNIGSGGRQSGSSAGGAIKVTVSGALVHNGEITANGNGTTGAGAPSAGSVWITASTISGSGSIAADGGVGNSGYPGGGGGRISVCVNSGGFGSFSGSMTAYGGDASGDGAAGTIYRQRGDQDAGWGSLTIDNSDRLTAPAVQTPIPVQVGGVSNELQDATVIVTNNGHLGVAETQTAIGNFFLYGTALATLESNELWVYSIEHHLDNPEIIEHGGPTNQVDHYDQVIWLGMRIKAGSMLLFE